MSRFFSFLMLLVFAASTIFAHPDDGDELYSAPVQAIHQSVSPCTLVITAAAIVGVSALILGSGKSTSHSHNAS